MGEAVVVRVTITNPGDRPLGILRWFTPVDGVERPLFSVQRDGAAVPYVGRLVKRAAPTSESYLTVPARDTLTVDVDLAAHYALTTPGRYDVAYDATSPELYRQDGDAPSPGALRSDVLHVVVAPAAAPHP